MAKEFECADCKKYLGEMNKGKLLPYVSLRCPNCEIVIQRILTAKKLENLGPKRPTGDQQDFGDLFKDIFKGKGPLN